MVISENNAKATISVGLAALLQAAVAIITVAITLAIWGHDVKLLKEVLRDQVIEDAQFRIELLKKIDDMNIRTVKLELSLEYMKEELLSNSQKIAQDNRTKAANKR